ncbi:EAL domain-containing protein [Vibrio tritonius]|uniref:EAL domain-containing protein n=1 Tax=Vibrio tritonius TaxID=1435069 RepID=A0ABS7YPR4_9VIBR|nr:EAL domain-containing protein [Vibrio tritonius]MCA2017669.1 EAL domain-containing protein [Vibrio tritonius]
MLQKSQYEYSRYFRARLYSFFVYLFILISGGLMAYHTITQDVERQARQSISNIIEHMDEIFFEVDETAIFIKHYVHLPCDALRRIMTVRALTIPSGLSMELELPTGYCSSIDGFSLTPIHPTSDASLFLAKGYIQLNALMYVTNGISTELSKKYFLDQIDIRPYSFRFQMHVGQLAISMPIEHTNLIPGMVVHSDLYPYSISVDYDLNLMVDDLHDELLITLLFLLFFPAVLSYQCYKFLTLPRFLAREIRKGIRAGQFRAYVQPILTKDGSMAGGEVLVRWHHPKKGIISPYEFIDLVEKGQLAARLSTTLFSQVAKQLKPHAHNISTKMHLSFNLSAQQLLDRTIVYDCVRFISVMNNEKIKLVLELTEREQVTKEERIFEMYNELYAAGVRFSIDDFGTGHSSLIYLQMFEVDYIKIDKQFIDLIGQDAISNNIVNNLLDLSQRLEIPTVAEGIEQVAQMNYLQSHGVDYFQGYLFSKPIPLEQFITEWLLNTTRPLEAHQ